ncbi:NAD(P)H-hydrate dehydratase [Salinibacterium sp. SYSU T00001]|uniref:NAD(P)H-hydrate dehydratase n=1 Tax=Homoserinimonas sedimenticola TaxID=2986805 RepID=UPI002236AA10|nr:NAD(P)H-hydrate dehydratase [Salinibacterium sedimenticola]MCW4386615.1 NAD(P)H-hydrate dehydratase [Salinibacterium sedimenticola]
MNAPDEWTPERAARMIARPSAESDKYSRGVLGIVTGSDEYPGAAVLGVSAALATGVGMVRYLGPERPAGLVLAACPEVVTAAGRVQAWLAGSGMSSASSSSSTSSSAVEHLVGDGLPVVLDAGALDLVHDVRSRAVLTPHHREFARLRDLDPAEVTADPARCAREGAASLGAVVLLKGHRTLVAAPDGHLIECPPASPWLATAGTGDVLAGILGALLATHSEALEADEGGRMLAQLAATASVVHALAAERASAGGPMTTRALIEAIPATIAGLLA